MLEQRKPNKLSNEQKTGFVLLLIFGIMALSFGVLKIRNTMYKPFSLTNNIPSTIATLVKDISYLQYRDTDKDDLNDFEELYVYQTSPYLADTDSDGVDDKTEIAKGQNPNCASGRPCDSTPVISGMVTSGTILGVTAPVGPAPTDLNLMLKDPKLLRPALLEAGVDKTILDKLNDNQLLQVVQELMTPSGTAQLNKTN